MAEAMGLPCVYSSSDVESLYEHNPMLGHRGCRLGGCILNNCKCRLIAILGAALELKKA